MKEWPLEFHYQQVRMELDDVISSDPCPLIHNLEAGVPRATYVVKADNAVVGSMIINLKDSYIYGQIFSFSPESGIGDEWFKEHSFSLVDSVFESLRKVFAIEQYEFRVPGMDAILMNPAKGTFYSSARAMPRRPGNNE